MSVIQMRVRKRVPPPRPSIKRKATRVYAIAFDLDSATAERLCGPNWRGTCYAKIASVFEEFGFSRMQGSVYFGDQDSTPINCMRAVVAVDMRFAWFGKVVRDLRMLRVDEDNDMMPLLGDQLRLGDRGEEVA
jgi:virulence-associated protein VapD